MKKRTFITFCVYLAAAAVILFCGAASASLPVSASAGSDDDLPLCFEYDAEPIECIKNKDVFEDVFECGEDESEAVVCERSLNASSNAKSPEFFLKCSGMRWGYYEMGTRSKGTERKEFYTRLFNALVKVWNNDSDIKDAKVVDTYNYELLYVVYSDLGLTKEEAKETYFAFLYDNPVFYFLSKKYLPVVVHHTDGTSSNAIMTYTYEDYLSGKSRTAYQAAIEKFITASSSVYAQSDNNYKKALKLHNKILESITYTSVSGKMLRENYYHSAHNIVGGTYYGKGVCETYAKIYQLVASYNGLDCIYILGKGNDRSGSSGNHVWNIIRLDDGNFYCVDVTWDDGKDTTKYYAKGTTAFGDNHVFQQAGWNSESQFFYSLPSNLSKGNYNTNVTKLHSHTYGGWTTERKPDCISPGIEWRKCSVCGHMEQHTSAPKGHNCTEIKVTPTCTKAGYTLHKCTVCDYSYKDNEVKAAGHKYSMTTKAAKCDSYGYDEHKCTICGHIFTDNPKKPLGHSFEDKSVSPATCTGDGKTVCTCKTCGLETEKVLPAAGHKYQAKVTHATKTTEGFTEYVCSVCGDTYRDSIVPAGGGNYVLSSTKAPTCDKDGENVYFCSETGKTYKQIVKAKGHTYKATVKQSTCSEKGCTEYTCTVCGAKYTDSETPCHGHYFVSKKVAATADKAAYIECTCSVCNIKYTINDDGSVKDMPLGSVKIAGKSGFTGLTVSILDEKGNKLPNATINAGGGIFYSGKSLTGKCSAVFTLAGYAKRSIDFTAENGRSPLGEVLLCQVGDVNADGKCDSADVSLMQQKLSGWSTGFKVAETADVDLSGKFDANDLSVFQQYLAGWNVALGK